MKRYIWIPLLLLAALAYADVTPKSLQSVLQGGTRTLAPNATTDAVTINNGVLGRFPLHSTARMIPTASSTVAGLVKIGSGLAMSNGVLNNTGMAGVASFNGRAGAVKPGFSDYSASMIKGLATVAKTGSYADLTGKPTIPAAQVQADWNQSNPAAVDFIKGRPTIPTALSQLTQSSDYRTVTDAEKAKWDSQSNAVTKVNDQTGDVVLTATDVGADPLGSATSVQSNLDLHAGLINNPHQVTKSQVGLGNVPNVDPTNPANITQSSGYRFTTDTEKTTWNSKEPAIPAGTTAQYYRGDKTMQTLNKAAVGLGNVDNTSDANKPVSTATQTALDAKVALTAFAAYTTVDRLPTSVFASYSATRMAKVNPVYSGTLSTTNADGTHRLNVLNTVARSYTPLEGDVDTDSNGKLWLYHSGQWVEKGAAYTLPTASASSLGGVKVGNNLSIDGNGVLSAMVNSLTASGLITAGLAGDQTVSTGFAYITTETGKWTFNTYTSSKQFALFANYSGTLCAATGSKVYWPNPVTFENQSSLCAKVPKGARVTAQMNGGKTYAVGNKNLQKIVTAEAPPVIPDVTYTPYFSYSFNVADGSSPTAVVDPVSGNVWQTESDTSNIGNITSGTYAIVNSANTTTAYVQKTSLTAKTDVSAKVDLKMSAVTGLGSTGYVKFLTVGNGGGDAAYVELVTASGTINQVRVKYQRGTDNTTQSLTANFTPVANTYYTFDLRLKHSSTTSTTDGSVQLLINGTEYIPATPISTYIANTNLTNIGMRLIVGAFTNTWSFKNFVLGYK